MSAIDPCSCGLHPQVKEIKTVVYLAVCPCGKHGPAMQVREWAVSEWNKQLTDADEDQGGVRRINAKC